MPSTWMARNNCSERERAPSRHALNPARPARSSGSATRGPDLEPLAAADGVSHATVEEDDPMAPVPHRVLDQRDELSPAFDPRRDLRPCRHRRPRAALGPPSDSRHAPAELGVGRGQFARTDRLGISAAAHAATRMAVREACFPGYRRAPAAFCPSLASPPPSAGCARGYQAVTPCDGRAPCAISGTFFNGGFVTCAAASKWAVCHCCMGTGGGGSGLRMAAAARRVCARYSLRALSSGIRVVPSLPEIDHIRSHGFRS